MEFRFLFGTLLHIDALGFWHFEQSPEKQVCFNLGKPPETSLLEKCLRKKVLVVYDHVTHELEEGGFPKAIFVDISFDKVEKIKMYPSVGSVSEFFRRQGAIWVEKTRQYA